MQKSKCKNQNAKIKMQKSKLMNNFIGGNQSLTITAPAGW